MKKIQIFVGIALVVFASLFTVNFTEKVSAETVSAIPVVINGNAVTLNPGAYIIDGKAMVPLKQIFERMNATVTWHAEGETLSVFSKDGLKATISAESSVVNIQGKAVDVGTNLSFTKMCFMANPRCLPRFLNVTQFTTLQIRRCT